MNKIILWVFVGLIFISAGYVVISSANNPDINVLEIGIFVILSLTLITLIFYTFHTNILSSISQSRWARESVLNATYEMKPIANTTKTSFSMINPSTLIIRAKVRCDVKVYGSEVEMPDGYNGKRTWVLYPQQTTTGVFDIAPLLEQKGKIPQKMIDEQTPENRMKQFTMDLTIEFKDEEDIKRLLPTRGHFFDFKVNQWVPIITESDGWE